MSSPTEQTPSWVRDAVFYQIFPDRFARSERVNKPAALEAWDAPPTYHGYKGGDLRGIVEKLDWLTDLGVNAIYLNPIFQSAANHRYHTHDYFAVDPLLGGDEAFEDLLTACHDRGLRVVLDGVFNHSSRGFFRFHDVLENGPNSPWTDWFIIHDWPLHPYDAVKPANYDAWWGLKALPRFNTDNPHVREYLMQVAEHWAHRGIDGWRLDVPEEIETPGFWEEFRQRVRAVNPDLYLVGEIWGEATWWISEGNRFDATMNYQLGTAIISYAVGSRVDTRHAVDNSHYHVAPPLDAQAYADRVTWLLDRYPESATLANLNLLDSHDTGRVLTLAGGDVESVKLSAVLLLTFPGAPCIYYGTEIGMPGSKDPDNRRGFPWDESKWNHELLRSFRELISLRREHPALRSPSYERVFPAAGDDSTMLYVFARQAGDDHLVVAVNAGDERETAALPVQRFNGYDLDLLWGEAEVTTGKNHTRLSVAPRTAAIWQLT
jgi:neopullulanase